MPITAADQAFLQMIARKKVVTDAEARESMDAIGQQVGSFGEDDLKETVKALNKKLAAQDLAIRGCYGGSADAPVVHLALVNLASDDVAKLQGDSLDEKEVDALKRVLEALAKGDDYAVARDDLPAQKGKLSSAAFEAFCDGLLRDRWLAMASKTDLTFGPRAYLELSDVLRGHGVDVPQMVSY